MTNTQGLTSPNSDNRELTAEEELQPRYFRDERHGNIWEEQEDGSVTCFETGHGGRNVVHWNETKESVQEWAGELIEIDHPDAAKANA